MIVGFIGVCRLLDPTWELQTRPILTITTFETVGPNTINSGETSLTIPVATHNWQEAKSCVETSQGGLGSPAWTTPVASLYDTTEDPILVTCGGVSLTANLVYHKAMKVDLYCQYDVVLLSGLPRVQNYAQPADKTWQEHAPIGPSRTRILNSFAGVESVDVFDEYGALSGLNP